MFRENCGICMDPTREKTPCCRNFYHNACLREWANHCNPFTCPSCRCELIYPNQRRTVCIRTVLQTMIIFVGVMVFLSKYRLERQGAANRNLWVWIYKNKQLHNQYLEDSYKLNNEMLQKKATERYIAILSTYENKCNMWRQKSIFTRLFDKIPDKIDIIHLLNVDTHNS